MAPLFVCSGELFLLGSPGLGRGWEQLELSDRGTRWRQDSKTPEGLLFNGLCTHSYCLSFRFGVFLGCVFFFFFPFPPSMEELQRQCIMSYPKRLLYLHVILEKIPRNLAGVGSRSD